MPLDALCLSGLVRELDQTITGGKIDKIYQPGRDEILLALRTPSHGTVRLLLSANPSHPRPQLTRIARENPDTPPMFCMLLRKHLSGARLLAVEQPPLERVVCFTLEALNELGDRVERKLVLEAIGRRSNLILLDEAGRILDCMRRVESQLGTASSQQRALLPGMFYRLPPAQEKLDPLSQSREDLERLLSAAPAEASAEQWLLNTFSGLSPLVCRELAFRAGGSTDVRLNLLGAAGQARLLDGLLALLNLVQEHRFSPVLLMRDGAPWDFTFFPVQQYGNQVDCISFPTFSELLDRFYEQREHLERVKQRGQDLIRSVTTARDRTARKIAHQEQELAATQNRERLRELGDILTSNLHQLERGMARFRTTDFYDLEGKEIEIPLDPLLTPQQNAAKYYKEYNKAKTAQTVLTQQLEKNRRELDYLNSVLDTIPLAEGERDLGEIRQELTDTGYLRRPSKAKMREKRLVSKPMEFHSSSGLRISVGKNNTQNDLLTCKQAFKSDIWFHTQKIHGSHVILWTEGRAPDLQSVQEAACLAAYYSQARGSSKVAVDYTPVKYVKKPNGARPGMVIYTTYETAWVTPDEALAKKLRVR